MKSSWSEQVSTRRSTLLIFSLHKGFPCGQGYRHKMIVNDTSRITSEWRHNLRHHSIVVNYDPRGIIYTHLWCLVLALNFCKPFLTCSSPKQPQPLSLLSSTNAITWTQILITHFNLPFWPSMASSQSALYKYFCVSQNKAALNWTQVCQLHHYSS